MFDAVPDTETANPTHRAVARAKRSNASARAAMDRDEVVWVAADSLGGELPAQAEIRAMGYECFVLLETHRHRPDRTKNRYEITQRPALPQLLFIGVEGIPEHVLNVFEAHHATPMTDKPGYVLVVPADQLRTFADRNTPTDRDVDALAARAALFKIGDRIAITCGPLARMGGDITNINRDRVTVGVEIFGAITNTTMGVDDIREAV